MRRFEVLDSAGKKIASGSISHETPDREMTLRFGETYRVRPADPRQRNKRNRGRLCTLEGVVTERTGVAKTGEAKPDFFGLIVRFQDTRRQGRVGFTDLDYAG